MKTHKKKKTNKQIYISLLFMVTIQVDMYFLQFPYPFPKLQAALFY